MSNNHNNQLLTPEQIEVRVWATVVVVVTFVLAGIVAFMLYSLAFVTQPIKSMAPMDQAFAKMLNDIVLLIVGGIGGVMSKKGVQTLAGGISASIEKTTVSSPQPQAVAPSISPAPTASTGMFDFNFGGFKNPQLDEEWRAPPPPTTPADFIDPAKEEIAHERAAARSEA